MPTVTVAPDAAANSYISLTDAELYFEFQPGDVRTAWNAGDDPAKEAALIAATRILDGRSWAGTKAHALDENGLRWPRAGVYNADSQVLDSETIPAFLQQATCELAKSLIAGEVNAAGGESQAFPIESVSVGEISVNYDTEKQSGAGNYRSQYSNAVEMLIRPYLTGQRRTLKLLRS